MPTTRPAPRPMASYHRLVRRFPLVPIRDAEHLAEAHAVLEGVADRDYDDDEAQYVEVLATLIEAYESEHHPLPDAPPADVLRILMEAHGLTQLRLSSEAGISQSTIAQILSGRRRMALDHIDKLAARFRVSPAVFHARAAE